jgi:hypothetical protein
VTVIDDGARTNDACYRALRPILEMSHGRLVALTCPLGPRGWFYDAWTGSSKTWQRILVPAEECPRFTPAFLAEERAMLGPYYLQDCECQFVEQPPAR